MQLLLCYIRRDETFIITNNIDIIIIIIILTLLNERILNDDVHYIRRSITLL